MTRTTMATLVVALTAALAVAANQTRASSPAAATRADAPELDMPLEIPPSWALAPVEKEGLGAFLASPDGRTTLAVYAMPNALSLSLDDLHELQLAQVPAAPRYAHRGEAHAVASGQVGDMAFFDALRLVDDRILHVELRYAVADAAEIEPRIGPMLGSLLAARPAF